MTDIDFELGIGLTVEICCLCGSALEIELVAFCQGCGSFVCGDCDCGCDPVRRKPAFPNDPYRQAEILARKMVEHAQVRCNFGHLRDAIYRYRAACGQLPSPGAVRHYVAWCQHHREPISGQAGSGAPERPEELCQGKGYSFRLGYSPASLNASQSSWEVRDNHARTRCFSSRSRAKCVRWLEERYPDGKWTIRLRTGERTRVLDRWDRAARWASDADLCQDHR